MLERGGDGWHKVFEPSHDFAALHVGYLSADIYVEGRNLRAVSAHDVVATPLQTWSDHVESRLWKLERFASFWPIAGKRGC